MDANYQSKFLRYTLTSRQRLNPQYSMRAFARDLDVNVTSLSLALKGKRKLRLATIKKIVHSMDLSSLEAELLRSENKVIDDRLTLAEDKFLLIADWEYLAIVTMAEQGLTPANPKFIAQRLGISKEEAESAIKRLVRMNLIEIKNKFLKSKNPPIYAGDAGASEAIRKHHRQKLNLAHKAITLPVSKRLFSSITIPFNAKLIADIEKKIFSFRRAVEKKALKDGGEEIYTMCIQFFPLTKELDS